MVYKNTKKDIVTKLDGEHFGDLGLLIGKSRSATIVCKEDTEFAVLTKKDFKELLENAERIRLED